MLIVIDKRERTMCEAMNAEWAAGMILKHVMPGDISWQIKRTGRYDDDRYVIIPMNPEE